ncbi:MAG: hypothetical protein AAB425_10405 [Bdellovibrionota bacterium]
MIAILVFSACGSDSTTDVTATDTPSATYAYISQKILARSCTECHGTKGGVTLSTFEGVQKVVTAKDPDKSLLYTVIESDAMPQTGDPLTESEKALIKTWITNGAAND